MRNILSKRNRALLRELVVTDFKLRYQGSLLGYLWSLLRPLGLFAILYVVFVRFLKFGGSIEHFPVYLLLGIVLWGFFTEATMLGLHSIIARGELLRKINFPKYVVVLSGSLSALINLSLNLVVVFLFMFINKVDLGPSALLFPLLIIELYIFSLAVSFFLSAAFVKYRDVSHVWEVLLQGAFYATPILYPLSVIPIKAAKVLMTINPVAQIIQDSREVLITPQTTTVYELVKGPLALLPYIIVAVAILAAAKYFKASSKYFAENV